MKLSMPYMEAVKIRQGSLLGKSRRWTGEYHGHLGIRKVDRNVISSEESKKNILEENIAKHDRALRL